MKLATYLAERGQSQAEFARRIGVSRQTVNKYVLAQRIPHRRVMPRIVKQSGGQVRVGDFYASDADPADMG